MQNELNYYDKPEYRENPDLFIEYIFGESLWDKQRDILFSLRDNRQTSVRSSHGIGKSFVAGRAVPWFLYTHPNSKVITTAPSFRQVQDILWREIRKAKNRARRPLPGNLTTVKLDIDDDWFATGLSTDEPERFQGYHATYILLLVDEAAGVKEEIYEAAEGVVSSAHARTLLIGNPTAVGGTFYESFKPSSGYNVIHISSFDTPNFTEFGITLDNIKDGSWQQKVGDKEMPRPYLVTPYWVADKLNRWGEGTPMWDTRVLGQVPEQGEDTLISLRLLEAAANRELEVKIDDPECIGVDVARFGSDKTTFTYRKGSKVLDIRVFKKMDTMQTCQNLLMMATEYPNTILNIDVIGVGAGVFDRMCQLVDAKRVVPVNSGAKPNNKEIFLNKRAELYWGLRERFVQEDVCFDRHMEYVDDMMAQVSNIKFEFTPRGQIKIESKEDMKKRGLSSPDLADGLMMAFGIVGAVSFASVNFTTVRRPSLAETIKSAGKSELVDEDQRKQAELQADLAIIQQAKRDASLM